MEALNGRSGKRSKNLEIGRVYASRRFDFDAGDSSVRRFDGKVDFLLLANSKGEKCVIFDTVKAHYVKQFRPTNCSIKNPMCGSFGDIFNR